MNVSRISALAALVLLAACSDPPRRPGGSTARRAREEPTPFDGARAFAAMDEMVRRGNRWYGAPERDAALAAMVERFRPYVDSIEHQRFEVAHPDGDGEITMVNVLLRQHPEKRRRLIVGSHWDTRLWAEEDRDPARQEDPIPGANDGTSGIAVMIELARLLDATPLEQFGVDFVLFDGEEYGRPGNDEYCQGSHHLARHLDDWYPSGARPEGAIVMDMVADADLGIPKERNSIDGARWLVNAVWGAARERDERAFDHERVIHIIDDHVPLNQAGIPSILIIDYDYPWWHTHGDTMERCSAESLARVGAVVLTALRRVDASG